MGRLVNWGSWSRRKQRDKMKDRDWVERIQ
jgi:hypothetical protein